MDEDLTPGVNGSALLEDMQRMAAMQAERDPAQLLAKMVDYHMDMARCDRTSRGQLYAQVGLLISALQTLLRSQSKA